MTSKSEVWKAHPDIVGIEVSTFGNVRTLDRTVTCKGNRTRLVKGHVLKPGDDGNGYLKVGIQIDGERTMKYVHRLVAETFLPNPDNLPQVNHKDCDRGNNNVENLEFCTVSYNIKYREKYGISNADTLGRPVLAINLSTMEVSHFRAQREASRVLGFSDGNISGVIKGRLKQTNGFLFVKDDDNADDAINRKLHEIGVIGLKIK